MERKVNLYLSLMYIFLYNIKRKEKKNLFCFLLFWNFEVNFYFNGFYMSEWCFNCENYVVDFYF